VACLGVTEAAGDTRLRPGELLLLLCEVLDLFLELLRRGCTFRVGVLQLVDLELDRPLTLGERRLGLPERLLQLEQTIELDEPLGHLPLALLELRLRCREGSRAPIECGGLLGQHLLLLDLAAGDVDLLGERRPELLLARKRGIQLDTQRVDVRCLYLDRSGDCLAGRPWLGLILLLELGSETGAEPPSMPCSVTDIPLPRE
jgi:hypothetical protein